MTDMRDVAIRAGVSTATVSRYFHSPEKVKPSTSKKVAAAIEETGYRPNLLARNFRISRAFAILVLVPDVSNPFFSDVIKGIESIATDSRYDVFLGNTSYSAQQQDEYSQLVLNRRADGIITLCGRVPEPIQNFVTSREIPFVTACESTPHATLDNVGIDNIDAARRLALHLIQLGHRRIGVITGPASNQHSIKRLAGLEQAIKESRHDVEIAFIAEGDYSVRSGYNAVTSYVTRDRPDALFCFSDQMAFGALRRLHEKNIKVPDEISVAGFDDLEAAQYSIPSLTTVSQPAIEIGKEAARLLLRQLNGKATAAADVELAADIIVRESTISR